MSLTVLNVLGQRVAALWEGPQEAGVHTAEWHGRDDRGRRIAGGVYLYRLRAGSRVQTRRLVLLR